MSIRVLILGNTSDNHLKRFERYMNNINLNQNIIFEVFNENRSNKTNLFTKTYHINNFFPLFFYKLKYLDRIFGLIDRYLSFRRVGYYDLINIHFLSYHSFFTLHLYKKKAKKIMISPWGSDVYRVPNILRFFYKKTYNRADFISVTFGIKFMEDIRNIFSVPKYKFVNLGFGSEIIDLLIENENLTKEKAKKELNLEEIFVITCGYNRSKAQNHLKIISSIIAVKSLLPSNVVIWIPLTYGPLDDAYIQEIEDLLIKSEMPYKLFNKYMNSKDILYLRKCTDLFVHIQDTDANSATLQEYLFCGTNIINGCWLKYPQFEKYGTPYLLTETIDTLVDVLKNYFSSGNNISIPPQLHEDIKLSSWSNKIIDWYNFYNSLS